MAELSTPPPSPAPLSLDTDAIRIWLANQSPVLPGVFALMERREPWVLDYEASQLEDALYQFADQVEHVAPEAIDAMRLTRVLAFVRSGRALRIIAALDELRPGFVMDTAMLAESARESTPEANIVFLRLQMLSRVDCLHRVFSPERRAELIEVLTDAESGEAQNI